MARGAFAKAGYLVGRHEVFSEGRDRFELVAWLCASLRKALGALGGDTRVAGGGVVVADVSRVAAVGIVIGDRPA